MGEQQGRATASEAAAKKSPKEGRSPAYPAIDLGLALEKANLLHKALGKNFAHVSAVMEGMGYSAKSGTGRLVFAALRKFGLIETRGTAAQKSARVTDDAVRILIDDRPNSEERRRLLQKLALRPTAHRELWTHYSGTLPTDADLLFRLKTDRGFSAAGAKDFLDELKKTLAFAQVDASTKIDGSPASEGEDPEDQDDARDPMTTSTIEHPALIAAAGKTPPPPSKPPVRFVFTLGENALEITMRSRVSKKQFETIKSMIALAADTFVDPEAQ